MPAISGFDAALEPFHQELLDNYYVNKETWQKVTINKSRFLTSFTELDQIKRAIFMAIWMTNMKITVINIIYQPYEHRTKKSREHTYNFKSVVILP
jgi:hypothetical protein